MLGRFNLFLSVENTFNECVPLFRETASPAVADGGLLRVKQLSSQLQD